MLVEGLIEVYCLQFIDVEHRIDKVSLSALDKLKSQSILQSKYLSVQIKTYISKKLITNRVILE